MMHLHSTQSSSSSSSSSSSDDSTNSSSTIISTKSSPQISLISQPSLPSIPSLTSYHHHHYQNDQNTLARCIATLNPHTTTTTYPSSLVLAGNRLFAASSDREIRSWRRDDGGGPPLGVAVTAGRGAVKSLVVVNDKIFSAHQDHKVRVWRRRRINGSDDVMMTEVATLPRLSDRLMKLVMQNNRVRIRRHKTATWVHHVDAVSALALSADGSLLYSVSWDRTVNIWRTRDFKCVESIAHAHEDAINALAVSQDGHIYTGSADKKIKVWRKSLEKKKKHYLVATLDKHNSGINALALGNSGDVLYSGACDRSILVWEKQGGSSGAAAAAVGAIRGHTKSILCLAVVETSSVSLTTSDILCSGSADKTVRIWRDMGKRRSYSCMAVLAGHGGPVKCLTVAPTTDDFSEEDNDETTSLSKYVLYSGSLDGDIKVWHIITSTF